MKRVVPCGRYCREPMEKSSLTMKLRSLTAAFALLLLLLPDAHGLDEDLQAWGVFLVNGPTELDPKLRWSIEVQPRVGDDLKHIERLLLRPSLYYRVADHWTTWLGYAWTPSFHSASYDRRFDHEHRIWQQAQREEKYESVSEILRLRLEERFIENISPAANRVRVLYRLSSNEPLLLGQTFTAYDELLLDLNDTQGPRAGFDRNRVFAGPYWQLGKWRLEAGYLNEFSIRRNIENRDIHAVVGLASLSL